MQPPLTSLSWHFWSVWADWCADYRPKAEPFARKVVRSLRKMEAVGCDPRMLLYSGSGRSATYSAFSPKQEWKCGRKEKDWFFLSPHTQWALETSQLYWVRKTRLWEAEELGSPADLPKPLQDSRLSWKFWKCVNRRALGIKDSVIGD